LDLLVVEGVVLPEGFFRYVTLSRVAAYAATGWPIIGATLSPHDGQHVAIMAWPAADKPLEPGKNLQLARTAASGVDVRAGRMRLLFIRAVRALDLDPSQ
jgi:hypothetical protein